MTAKYKRLTSYFLERSTSDATNGGSGYYGNGGTGTVSPLLPYSFNSVRVDQERPLSTLGMVGNAVTKILPQSDGKMFVLGAFSSIGGSSRGGVARLNADGSVDSSFGQFGVGVTGEAYVGAVQSDGQVVVAGNFSQAYGGTARNNVARFNASGNLDYYFNPNVTGGAVRAIAIQTDGKIIIGGDFTAVGGVSKSRIARLNVDGTLDTGFTTTVNSTVFSIVLQSDGKILVGGSFYTVNSVSLNNFARLNVDGSIDTSFKATMNVAAVYSVAFSSTGRILVGSSSGLTSFSKNADSYQNFSLMSGVTVKEVAVQSDDKILVGGSFTALGGVSRSGIARLNSDGTLDRNFDLSQNGTVSAIAIQTNGNILLGGTFSTLGGVTSLGLARLKEIVTNAPYRVAYTVPQNTQVVVSKMFVCNHNAFPVVYDILIRKENDLSVSEKNYYIWDSLLKASDFQEIKSGITLSAGDEVLVYSSTDESISFNFFGVELS